MIPVERLPMLFHEQEQPQVEELDVEEMSELAQLYWTIQMVQRSQNR